MLYAPITYHERPERDEDLYEPPTRANRFWAKVAKKSCGCWAWTAYKGPDGYGRFYAGKPVLAHRFAYELLVGPIPEGLQIDHLCRNRACVNPAHLEPVTQEENIRRGESGAYLRNRTHCNHGHPFSGDNLIERGGRRICRACESARNRRYRQRVAGNCRDCGKQLGNVNAVRCNGCNQKWRNAHRDAERGAAAEGCSGAGQPPSERRDAGPGGGDGCASPAAVRSSAGGRS